MKMKIRNISKEIQRAFVIGEWKRDVKPDEVFEWKDCLVHMYKQLFKEVKDWEEVKVEVKVKKTVKK